jgi:hypothetical protein
MGKTGRRASQLLQLTPHENSTNLDPKTDNTIVGGHAVVRAGYDAKDPRVISWGQYYRPLRYPEAFARSLRKVS